MITLTNMKYLPTIIFVFLLLLTLSCSNEEVSPNKTIVTYMNLEIGNYWVYEWVEIDDLGAASPLNQRDSVFIEKDTIIDGKTYSV